MTWHINILKDKIILSKIINNKMICKLETLRGSSKGHTIFIYFFNFEQKVSNLVFPAKSVKILPPNIFLLKRKSHKCTCKKAKDKTCFVNRWIKKIQSAREQNSFQQKPSFLLVLKKIFFLIKKTPALGWRVRWH